MNSRLPSRSDSGTRAAPRPWPRWLFTLKFKIALMAAVTSVLAAVGTVQVMLPRMQHDTEQLLLEAAGQDRERTAALLASKLHTLRLALSSVASHAAPGLWDSPAALSAYLRDKPALNGLFDSVFVAAPDGRVLLRLDKGLPAATVPSIADRDYFRRALLVRETVVSEPLLSKITKAPLVVIALPVLGADGHVLGVLGGALALRSSALFAELAGDDPASGARNLVMTRQGVLLAHTDPKRVLGQAAEEPGLTTLAKGWLAKGSPAQPGGIGLRSEGFLVSLAGIPQSDWVLVRLTPEGAALAPMATARRIAWQAAALAGLVAALLAGGLAWFLTRPITALRALAERRLHAVEDHDDAWPQGQGEIGDLARAFQHLVAERTRRQHEMLALVGQLEAVLDHAEVGIALSRNGRFELVSRQLCHLMACTKADLVGHPTRRIYGSDEAYAELSARARPAFMAQGTFDGEVQLQRLSGQPFWGHMRGRAVQPGDLSQGTVWTIVDVTTAREHRDHLTFAASHDSLTGLNNRAAFERLLETATASAGQAPFCALFIDLDRFKQVNDNGGHAAGDALLRDLAQRLTAQLRKSDVVARLGGDEFAVLLPNCPEPKARQIAEQLRQTVLDYRLAWEGHSYSVGASVGLVVAEGQHATAADVLSAADAACYAAKRLGRNRVEVHMAPA